jgi:hypothetical protein
LHCANGQKKPPICPRRPPERARKPQCAFARPSKRPQTPRSPQVWLPGAESLPLHRQACTWHVTQTRLGLKQALFIFIVLSENRVGCAHHRGSADCIARPVGLVATLWWVSQYSQFECRGESGRPYPDIIVCLFSRSWAGALPRSAEGGPRPMGSTTAAGRQFAGSSSRSGTAVGSGCSRTA